ncbi:MAG: hypothetical protein GY752_09340 [bacterium]|nr:hypothetical protein [bacterium]MCP4799164.1 hypothetical protein [bacterium]
MHNKPNNAYETITFRGKSMTDVYDKIHRQVGSDAQLLDCRMASEKTPSGLGQRSIVEVLVVDPKSKNNHDISRKPATSAIVESEVLKIEKLIESVEKQYEEKNTLSFYLNSYPLSNELRKAGVSTITTLDIARKFIGSSKGLSKSEAVRDLSSRIKTSGSSWDLFIGYHMFKGKPGSGKTELLIGAATKLKNAGKKVLVVSLNPAHEGKVIQLQESAKLTGFDAAIMRDSKHLSGCHEYFSNYDAVLIDTDNLDDASEITHHSAIHKHFVISADVDTKIINQLLEYADNQEFDWLAIGRGDLAANRGQLFELAIKSNIPVSMMSQNENDEIVTEIPGIETFTSAIEVTLEEEFQATAEQKA